MLYIIIHKVTISSFHNLSNIKGSQRKVVDLDNQSEPRTLLPVYRHTANSHQKSPKVYMAKVHPHNRQIGNPQRPMLSRNDQSRTQLAIAKLTGSRRVSLVLLKVVICVLGGFSLTSLSNFCLSLGCIGP